MYQNDLYKKSLRNQKMIAAQKKKRDPDLQRLSRRRGRESEAQRSSLADGVGSFVSGLLPSVVRYSPLGAAYYLAASVPAVPENKVAAGMLATSFLYAAGRGFVKLFNLEEKPQDYSRYKMSLGHPSFSDHVLDASLKLGVRYRPRFYALGQKAGPLVAVGLAAYFSLHSGPQPDQVSPVPKALVKLEAQP